MIFCWKKKLFFLVSKKLKFQKVNISLKKKIIIFGLKKLKFRWKKKKSISGQKSWNFVEKKNFFFFVKKVEISKIWNLVGNKKKFFVFKKVEI